MTLNGVHSTNQHLFSSTPIFRYLASLLHTPNVIRRCISLVRKDTELALELSKL